MNQEILTGTLLDERVELSLTEISHACACSTEWVVELVEEGALEPIGGERSSWRFSATSLKRARAAIRLQQDLRINLAGIALALDLIEEIETLREHLYRLEMPDGN